MEMRLELIVVPVSDVDRARDFYAERAGFHLDVDHRGEGDFRVVQLTPPGSGCSIALMRNEAAGSLRGLHLVVSDIVAAREELVRRGLPAGELFHFDPAAGQVPGPHPERIDHGTFLSFEDPDGNGWLVQEVRRGASG